MSQEKTNKTHSRMDIYSRPSIQNAINWWLWIWKNKCLLNLINRQTDIDKFNLYAND